MEERFKKLAQKLADNNRKDEYENLRKQFWIDVYIAYVGAANSMIKEGAANWADYALKAFDSRFKLKEN